MKPLKPMKTSKPASNLLKPPGLPVAKTAFGVTAAGLAVLAGAEASILYTSTGPSGVTIDINQEIYFDLEQTGPGPHYSATPFSEWDFNLYFSSNNASKPVVGEINTDRKTAVLPSLAYVDKLDAGSTIGSSSTWYYTDKLADNGNGPWAGGAASKYVGLNIRTGNDTNYGWAELSYDAGGTMTLHGFAYETTANTSIEAGAVPEPSTVALLALGLGAGALALRRRQAPRNQ